MKFNKGKKMLVPILLFLAVVSVMLAYYFHDEEAKIIDETIIAKESQLTRIEIKVDKIGSEQEKVTTSLDDAIDGFNKLSSTVDDVKKAQTLLMSDNDDIHNKLRKVRDEQSELRIILTKKQNHFPNPLPVSIVNESINVVPVKAQQKKALGKGVGSVIRENEAAK